MPQKNKHPNIQQDRTAFFVEPDLCVTHGCCIDSSPSLFAWSDNTDGTFSSAIISQPTSDDEVQQMLEAIVVCPMDCIRYGGKNLQIIKLLKDNDAFPTQIVHNQNWKDRILRMLKSLLHFSK